MSDISQTKQVFKNLLGLVTVSENDSAKITTKQDICFLRRKEFGDNYFLQDIAVTKTALSVSFRLIFYAQCGWNLNVLYD